MLFSFLRCSRNIASQVNSQFFRAPAESLFKISSNVLKNSALIEQNQINRSLSYHHCFSGRLVNIPKQKDYNLFQSNVIRATPNFLQTSNLDLTQKRTLTKFSLRKGKRKSVKVVLRRFKRLDWGIWIRTKCGRKKRLYKKTANRKRRLRQHVFCNASQSWLLDSMVTKFWRKPKHYVDDPYAPYHTREEFYITRKKPIIPE